MHAEDKTAYASLKQLCRSLSMVMAELSMLTNVPCDNVPSVDSFSNGSVYQLPSNYFALLTICVFNKRSFFPSNIDVQMKTSKLGTALRHYTLIDMD